MARAKQACGRSAAIRPLTKSTACIAILSWPPGAFELFVDSTHSVATSTADAPVAAYTCPRRRRGMTDPPRQLRARAKREAGAANLHDDAGPSGSAPRQTSGRRRARTTPGVDVVLSRRMHNRSRVPAHVAARFQHDMTPWPGRCRGRGSSSSAVSAAGPSRGCTRSCGRGGCGTGRAGHRRRGRPAGRNR